MAASLSPSSGKGLRLEGRTEVLTRVGDAGLLLCVSATPLFEAFSLLALSAPPPHTSRTHASHPLLQAHFFDQGTDLFEKTLGTPAFMGASGVGCVCVWWGGGQLRRRQLASCALGAPWLAASSVAATRASAAPRGRPDALPCCTCFAPPLLQPPRCGWAAPTTASLPTCGLWG